MTFISCLTFLNGNTMSLKTDHPLNQLSGHQPNQPTLLIGSPGSAKNALLTQFMFTEFSTNAHLYYVGSMPSEQLDYFIDDQHNLIDLDHADQSYRFNPIDWKSITDIADAVRIAKLLHLNLGLGSSNIHDQEGGFYYSVIVDYIAAIIWYLRTVTEKNASQQLSVDVCTIPHLIEFTKQGYERILSVLASIPRFAQFLQHLLDAVGGNKEIGQIIGRLASVEICFTMWGTPGLYWILAPGNPIVNGFDFTRSEEPLLPETLLVRSQAKDLKHKATLALYTDFICHTLLRNHPGDSHRAVVIDSYQSFEYPYLDTVIATGRGFRIHLYVAFDYVGPGARLSAYKSRIEFTTSCFGTILVGRQLLPEEAEFIASVPTLRGTLTPATLQNLNYGEFAGWLGTGWNEGHPIRGYEPLFVGYAPLSEESPVTDAMLEHVIAIQNQIQSLFTVGN
ncbi:hypothetical protein CWM47_28560 [Spirosoma pollinicola]|uniref:Uncharacterized protein n=2 Tax=Spirosoma pollinicola TaxID=2057025 RepID=A0A2K8Z6G0_9BACT|nr:hypothetical protein CWM47_28560 [Spirosoma pollinicola]